MQPKFIMGDEVELTEEGISKKLHRHGPLKFTTGVVAYTNPAAGLVVVRLGGGPRQQIYSERFWRKRSCIADVIGVQK